jgi:hypothetical protein
MRSFRLLLLGLLAALPAAAGEAYIPFLAADQPGVDSGRSTRPIVELHNLGGVTRRYSVRLTPPGDDGTKVRELVASGLLPAGESVQVPCCERESGLLVVSGAPQIAVGARLGFEFDQPPPNELLTRMPVVTARDALPAGSTAVLQGLVTANSDAKRSSFGILNFGREAAVCSIDTGTGFFAKFFFDLAEVVVPPLSVAAFPDLFSRIRGAKGAPDLEARMRVACDQPFYPFGVNFLGFNPFYFGLPWIEHVPPSVQLGNAP